MSALYGLGGQLNGHVWQWTMDALTLIYHHFNPWVNRIHYLHKLINDYEEHTFIIIEFVMISFGKIYVDKNIITRDVN